MKTNPDDNAFQEGQFGKTNTLTKREYFAIMVFQGAAVHPDGFSTKELALWSIEAADALIKELNNGK